MSAATAIAIDLRPVAQGLGLQLAQVEAVVELLDAGNTVPFITRYRKDYTGGLDEEQIRAVQTRLAKLRLLNERKQTILRSIESQGKLSERLAAEIEAAESAKQLEDIYLPFKPKKQTLATVARERGLEPLAEELRDAAPSCADLEARAADFVNPDKGLASVADALLGVGHILAESYSERADLRRKLRKILNRTGKLTSAKTEIDEKQAQGFRDYFAFSDRLDHVPPHRVLAINRGERAKMLRVKVEADLEQMQRVAEELLVPAEHPHADFLKGCARDALARLVFPSLEREVRRELTDQAEAHAVEVFARNLRKLLLQPPVRGRRVLAIDPGFKSGCKLVAIDEFGNLLEHALIHLIGKPERRAEAKAKVVELVARHQLCVAAIGNGTACRDSEELIGELLAEELKEQPFSYVIVNEAGASVYSTSPQGREELPDCDATVRGAVSIGRRLEDPLSELVKIDPANIGVGLYQHDVKAKHLRKSLDAVVESCVNYVGVDLNTASPALLRYVSGLNQLTARRVYDHRREQGPFRNREQLKEVVGFGEAAFIQAAGFLKISAGDSPLDATWIHPESYDIARKVVEKLGFALADLADKEKSAQLAASAAQLPLEGLAEELGGGELQVRDIVAQLARPGRDPREDLPPPIFKKGVIKLDDLSAGMELQGTVLNVVDFGAFVDIGLHDTGLVHISQLSTRYVRDPHDVVSVGDIVKVWVHEVDKSRRRVSLSMIPPGTQRGKPEKPQQRDKPQRERPPKRGKPASLPVEGRPAATTESAAPPAPPPPPPARVPRPPDRRPRPPESRTHKKFGDRRPQRPGGGGGGRPGGPGQRGARREEYAEQTGRGGAPRPASRETRPAAPLAPLTPGMREGKEPMRTFGDLMQFFQQDEPEPTAAAPAGETDAAAPPAPAEPSPAEPALADSVDGEPAASGE